MRENKNINNGPQNTTQKTKIVIFSKRKCKTQRSFKLYDENIDIVDSYTYLGVVFNYNGNYCTAKQKTNRSSI